jgi:FixJ family two-component response regulator
MKAKTDEPFRLDQSSCSGHLQPGIIAVVDDDPHIGDALLQWLNLNGLHVSCHRSAEGLLHSMHRSGSRVILHSDQDRQLRFPVVGAVLDLCLPGISGAQLAFTLLRLMPNLPIALISALSQPEIEQLGPVPSGITPIRKPFDITVLDRELLGRISWPDGAEEPGAA